MSKEDFKNEHLLKLQGKDYLPVAPRVVLFRAEHPDYSILTETRDVGGDTYVFAAVLDSTAKTLATAHKRVRKDGKGPAALWPLETAETGAIGRALALCGYGTLSGDLDEGDELADAPVKAAPEKVVKKPTPSPTAVKAKTADSVIAQLDKAKSVDSFNVAYDAAVDFLETVDRGTPDDVAVRQAGTRARNRVSGVA